MSFLSGLMRTVAPLALTALTGGAAAPLMVTIQQMALKAAITQMVKMAAQELGLPPSIVNMALSAAFSGSSDGTGLTETVARGGQGIQSAQDWVQALKDAGAPPYEIAKAMREVKEAVSDAEADVKNFLQDQLMQMNGQKDKEKLQKDLVGVKNGKESLLMKLAIALGKIADNKMEQTANLATQIGKFGEIKGKNQAQFSELNARMSASAQELSIVSNSISTVIKSVGEAAAGIARKS